MIAGMLANVGPAVGSLIGGLLAGLCSLDKNWPVPKSLSKRAGLNHPVNLFGDCPG